MQWRRQIAWRPRELDWRVAALFMVGSFLFALGSFPPYAQLVDPRVVGGTFFLGSLFFTAAGYSQFSRAACRASWKRVLAPVRFIRRSR